MSRWTTALALVVSMVLPGQALADEAPIRPEQVVRPAASADLASPLRVRAGEGRLATPIWTHQGLLPTAPGLSALRATARSGAPAYDPQSRAFYAAAEGTIVEVRAQGSLPVLVEAGVQGLDIDVRARQGLAVSREPDHTIVLHRFGRARGARRQVLLSGSQFFGPRFSPDGSRILVSESRAQGGHVWVVTLEGRSTDLGQGYGATWHPDGQRLVFSRISHDGHRLTDADLWEVELASRRERSLGRTPGLLEVEPVISPDGRWLAFQDGRGGDLYLARFPGAR